MPAAGGTGGSAPKRPVKPPGSRRQQLTALDAAEIFALRYTRVEDGGRAARNRRQIAGKYGVTPKTITGEHPPARPRRGCASRALRAAGPRACAAT